MKHKDWTAEERLYAIDRIAEAMMGGPIIPPLIAAHIGEVIQFIIHRPNNFLNGNWPSIEQNIQQLESLPKARQI